MRVGRLFHLGQAVEVFLLSVRPHIALFDDVIHRRRHLNTSSLTIWPFTMRVTFFFIPITLIW